MEFHFPSTAPLDLGAPTTRFHQNLTAIRILKRCQAEGRPVTAEEQAALAIYTGWGNSSVLRMLHTSDELRELLSEDEMQAALGSSLNAHYTALPVIGAMWEAVSRLGLDGQQRLRVVDPSAGVGHFKSCAPAAVRECEWIEVELDSLTAGILGLLHPGSKRYAQGYEKTNLPSGWFDLAISNVPFGNYGVACPGVPGFLKAAIHDFFFARSVELLRPGGILAFITSRFTLDKKETAVRAWLAQRMDLLAAVRLPNDAFKANAGTEVVTDVLLMQRRAEERTRGDLPAWVQTGLMPLAKGYSIYNTPVNQYYLDHPEMLLGKPALCGKMYRQDEFTLEPDGRDLAGAMRAALLPALPQGVARRQAETQAVVEQPAQPVVIVSSVKASTPDQASRIQGMQEVYQAAKAVLAAEVDGKSLFRTSELRHELNQVYDRFTARYGLVNMPVNAKLMNGAAELPFLKALEVWTPLSAPPRTAGISPAHRGRSLPNSDALDPDDALLICLDHKGRVDLPYIASLTGLPEAEVIQRLGERIFRLPQGGWETSDAYLSGNVREKLRAAEAAAEMDAAFERNVQALTGALPELLKPGEIRAPMGAGWVPPDLVEGFAAHLLEGGEYTRFEATFIPHSAHWSLAAPGAWQIPDGLLRNRWGTARMDALELIEDGLNATIPVVYDVVEEAPGQEKRVVNQTETVAAQQKLAEIKEAWDEWMWSDLERAGRLAAIYNERYNAFVIRRYDGRHLSTPGLNRAITLRPGQMDGAWRTIQNQSTMLAHEVGMGKTLTAIVAIMEAKRLGLVKKAVVVVPNLLTAQWHAQALLAYPNANVLCVTAADLAKERRGEFLSRIATCDWDIVICPQSSFKLLPVRRETQEDFFQEQIDVLDEYLWELKAEEGRDTAGAVKQIEKAKKNFAAKLERLAEMDKDSRETVTFEEMGIDMLVGDEWHIYKNLFYATKMTRIAGLSRSDSQRAFDMFIKSRWLLERGGKVVGLTGTPVTNTLAELFTMQRYFQMQTLKDLGLSHFDAWANQFALAEPGLEMTPDGAGFRMNTRFRKFVNVPELMKIWSQVADIRAIDEHAGIERPVLYGNKPLKVVTGGGQVLKEFVAQLAERAERIHSGTVRPEEDNMLLITGEGRKAALDMSLVVPAAPGAPMPKIDALCDWAARIYRASEAVKGTQIIFCDLATPKARPASPPASQESEVENECLTEAEAALTTNMYAEIRSRLAQRRIPPEEVAFVHDAKSADERNALFRAMNVGEVRILLGSTEKGSVGMNVQERCLAVHQITPPWRPGDIEQQLGRVLRQGNLYPEVFQFVHVTEGSFDGYTWQLLETKAGFIEQLRRGAFGAREIDDVGENVLTFSEIKAVASGNPKIMLKVVLDSELLRLEAVQAAWRNAKRQAEWARATLESNQVGLREHLKALQATIAIRDANATPKFQIALKPDALSETLETITEREAAGKRIRTLASTGAMVALRDHLDSITLGRYKGLEMRSRAVRSLQFAGCEIQVYIQVGANPLLISVGDSDAGVTQSLDARLRALDTDAENTRHKIEVNQAKIASLDTELAAPWEHQERCDQLRAQVDVLDKELRADERQTAEAAVAAVPTVPANDHAEADAEVQVALAAIEALHADPAVLARFAPAVVEQPVAVSAESLQQIEAEVEAKQAMLAFGQAILQALPGDDQAGQLSLFGASTGDWSQWASARNVVVSRRARKARPVQPGQATLF